MSESLDEQLKTNKLLKLLSIYYTARIDIKNFGDDSNSIEIIENSDEESIITYPEWFNKSQGTGAVIQSEKFSIDLKIKCINNGILNITLVTLDTINKETKKRFPAYIEYTSLIINKKEHLEENKLIWHDEPIVVKRKVRDNELITVHIEWKPFTSSSKYENKTVKKLEEKIENLTNKNTKQKEEIEKLKAKNKKLSKELSKIYNCSMLEFRKIKKELK